MNGDNSGNSMKRRRASCLILVCLLLMMSVPVSPVSAHEGDEPVIGWADCWFGHKENSLSSTEDADCASYYSEAPTSRLYDLRWVFLNVSAEEIPDDWTDTQLANLNAVFGQWNFQFQNGEQVIIPDAVAEANDYYDEWTLREALPDLRAQLGLSEDEATALAELKAQLAERYVSQEELDNITLDSTYNTGGMFRLASRARSESITVIVRPNLDASGRSGGPPPEFHISRGGGVELRTSQMNSPIGSTFPHEMGHYFGISHTHAPDVDAAEADFGFDQRWSRMDNDGDALKAVIGEDWSGEIGEPYLAYDDSDESLTDFHELMTQSFFWPTWEFLYSGEFEPFDNLSDFVQTGESGETVYRTNFGRNYEQGVSEWGGINCIWNSISDIGQCRYREDPIIRLNSSHPLLENKIFFENGTVSNLMSYITPPYENVTSRRGITDAQLDMIRLHANAPMRMLHTNHCLGTTLCGDDGPPDEDPPDDDPPDDDPPDDPVDEGNTTDQGNTTDGGNTTDDGNSTDNGNSSVGNGTGNLTCTEGDSFPYPDGCNTCYCDAEGNWACTEMGCVTEEEEPSQQWSLPGFGWPVALTMLGAAAILRRRRIEC